MFTIQAWVRHHYGLLLHTDRPAWKLMSAAGLRAAAHAAGIIAALDLTNRELVEQLAPTSRAPIDPPVGWLAAARDAAWQSITTLAADAHRLGCTSLPTDPCPTWAPVCVRATDIGSKLYPALANTAEPSTPPRFTRATVERISDDLARQTERCVSVRSAGLMFTLQHTDHPTPCPDEYPPDDDGLYQLGAASLHWQQAHQ